MAVSDASENTQGHARKAKKSIPILPKSRRKLLELDTWLNSEWPLRKLSENTVNKSLMRPTNLEVG